jgi:DNA adenine methylase
MSLARQSSPVSNMANDVLDNNKRCLEPFLKWAGGKRWFVIRHANLLPKSFNRYIEPFLGSGAVFFSLCPAKAILGDSNRELIDTYLAIKQNWALVLRYLKAHQYLHSRDYYYKVRSLKPKSLAGSAARFIYLNRTCWNGLYRVNQEGIFNVPIGTRESVIFADDRFDKVSALLQGAELHSCDFEDLIDMAEAGDFVFADPPYTVRHNNNSFIKYNEKLFSWFDQERLCRALKRAKRRGVQILATNACSESVKDLYGANFRTITVSRKSLISSKLESRKKCEELVIFTESKNER